MLTVWTLAVLSTSASAPVDTLLPFSQNERDWHTVHQRRGTRISVDRVNAERIGPDQFRIWVRMEEQQVTRTARSRPERYLHLTEVDCADRRYRQIWGVAYARGGDVLFQDPEPRHDADWEEARSGSAGRASLDWACSALPKKLPES